MYRCIALSCLAASGGFWPCQVDAKAARAFVVVVDAGHGGKDPGSLSPFRGGMAEKQATLAIARQVRAELADAPATHVILTRTQDRFLTLVERRKIAETKKADLFISIHADSAPTPAARGASIYTLTEDGRLVVVNRMAAGLELDGIALTGLDRDTAAILGDLKQRSAMNVSIRFASLARQALSPTVATRHDFRHGAQFALLKARGIPAALVETGYVTNEADADTLFSRKGQATIARAIARAIADTARNRDISSSLAGTTAPR